MSNSQNSKTEKRHNPRRKTRHIIKFRVTDLSSNTPMMLEKRGEIVDLSENGFGLITDYPLQKGHIITLTDKDHIPELPDFGIVQWVDHDKKLYRVGLRYIK